MTTKTGMKTETWALLIVISGAVYLGLKLLGF